MRYKFNSARVMPSVGATLAIRVLIVLPCGMRPASGEGRVSFIRVSCRGTA